MLSEGRQSTGVMGMAVVGILNWLRPAGPPLIRVTHLPRCFSRRSGYLTANVCGTVAPAVKRVDYRLNGGPWAGIRHAAPRVVPPNFTIELEAARLRPSANELTIRARASGRRAEKTSLEFNYDPSPVELPLRRGWSDADLDVQDGSWETFEAEDGSRVRPMPGFEGYDRILMVSGAFPGGRRIETEMVFDRPAGLGRHPTDWGFGVLPLWGGHADPEGERPRRGWVYACAWYYDAHKGLGIQLSQKFGGAPELPVVSKYRSWELVPKTPYRLQVECRPEHDGATGRAVNHLRMKWWEAARPMPEDWIELVDTAAEPLPAGEYAVALLAHRCQVDFGAVRIAAL